MILPLIRLCAFVYMWARPSFHHHHLTCFTFFITRCDFFSLLGVMTSLSMC